MSAATVAAPARARLARHQLAERLAPTLVAAILAAAYVIVSPPSLDLAAHLFRAHLFGVEGFGVWNNYWYSGHHIVGYSVLFPAVSAALTPQLAGALAATGTAALFEPLARRHFGRDAWLGAVVFGAATATNLYTGRLAFAFGALPALGAVLALDRERTWLASGLAFLAALCSPVAALFAALAAGGYALGSVMRRRTLRAALAPVAVAAAALAPVVVLAIAFPEGGSEPFGFPTMFPIVVLAVLALTTVPSEAITLRAGVIVYAAATLAVYAVTSPIGSNIARLGTFLAAPLAALLWWRRRMVLLAVAALPLLYLEWAAPVRDLVSASSDQSTSTQYYQPLLRFLDREYHPPAQPFRIEIPFTRFHWEAYVVATHFPLARGWERQLDSENNEIFYGGRLTAATYRNWLHRNAVRFVAAPDAQLDYSAKSEMALIDRGLPYLHLVMRSRHWRVYEVQDATPIVDGPATLRALGPDWLSLRAKAPGSVLVHVRFSPYWKLEQGSGCVAPDGQYTRVTLRRAGPVKLVTDFSLSRIRARSPRCS
ncbi:MAG TPA: hypothetical protein VGL51_08625 [Solirubrobacteraceae bacterium]